MEVSPRRRNGHFLVSRGNNLEGILSQAWALTYDEHGANKEPILRCVAGIWFIWSLWFVWFEARIKPDKPEQLHKQEQPADPLALLPNAIRYQLYALLFMPSPHTRLTQDSRGPKRGQATFLECFVVGRVDARWARYRTPMRSGPAILVNQPYVRSGTHWLSATR